jgi:DNA-binding CsgD family transcriptional regulator
MLLPRERGEPRTFRKIADQLSVRFDTVRFDLKNIYAKLHVRSRTEAVVKYLK